MPSAQIEALDLRRTDVNIIRTGQITRLGRSQEAIAVGKDFEDAGGEEETFLFCLFCKNLENQFVLGKAGDPFNFKLLGEFGESRHLQGLEFSNIHGFLFGVF